MNSAVFYYLDEVSVLQVSPGKAEEEWVDIEMQILGMFYE